MEIRSLTADDIPALAHIASRSFQRGTVPVIGPEALEGRTRIGAFENGRMEAQLTILDFRLFFGKYIRPCGGIAGVMCEPAARGRGYAGKLIQRALENMRDSGQYLSCLWPFDFRFYQAYGWDWTGVGRKYRLPIRILESSQEANNVHLITEGNAERLNPIYEAVAVRYNGAMVREGDRWKSALDPWKGRSAATYIYNRDGADEGFAIIRFSEKRKTIEVSDFAALTMRAHQGLLGLIRRHAMSAEHVSFWGPEDDPLWSVLYDWNIKTELWPRGMSRIVDVGPAMRALKPASPIAGSAVFQLIDEHAPWNAGYWRISSDGVTIDAKKGDADPGLTLDICGLSQAYWGTPSLESIRAIGRVPVHREADFEYLSSLLPPRAVWLTDGF